MAKKLRDTVYGRLIERGIVRFERGAVLGIFPTRQPTEREALLVSLLQAVDALPKVLAGSGMDKKTLRARGKQIAEGEFAGAAVRKAVDAVNAALITSVTAAAAAGVAGGAGSG